MLVLTEQRATRSLQPKAKVSARGQLRLFWRAAAGKIDARHTQTGRLAYANLTELSLNHWSSHEILHLKTPPGLLTRDYRFY